MGGIDWKGIDDTMGRAMLKDQVWGLLSDHAANAPDGRDALADALTDFIRAELQRQCVQVIEDVAALVPRNNAHGCGSDDCFQGRFGEEYPCLAVVPWLRGLAVREAMA